MSSSSNLTDNLDWRSKYPGVVERNEYMLTTEKYCDVSFQIPTTKSGFEIVRAHKYMMIGASPVFEAMFTGQFMESKLSCDVSIKVEDVDFIPFTTLLKFIYTGRLNDDLDSSNLFGTIYVARKYLISQLEMECSKRLEKLITTSTVVTILQNAQRFEDKELEQKCFTHLKSNFRNMLSSKELLYCFRDNLILLLGQQDLIVNNEVDLFEAMLRWSVAECQRKHLEVTPENQRNVLGDVIYLIQFSQMSGEDLSLKVIPTKILTSDEVMLLFQHLTVSGSKKSCLAPLPFSSTRTSGVYTVSWKDHRLNYRKAYDFSKGWTESVKFTADRNIDLVGCGFYGPQTTGNLCSVELVIRIKVIRLYPNENYTSDFFGEEEYTSESKMVILKEFDEIHVNANQGSVFHVDFKSPVRLESSPTMEYAIQFNIKGSRLGFSVNASPSPTTVNLKYGGVVTFRVFSDSRKYQCYIYDDLNRSYNLPEIRFQPV